MKHIKLFENFDSTDDEKIYDLHSTELYQMEKWIKSVWDRLENVDEEELPEFFEDVENTCGEDVAKIIDGTFTADHLHYYQTGSTVATGGIDTGEFIKNFDNIKNDVEEILKNYID